jgi:hypothetical protein
MHDPGKRGKLAGESIRVVARQTRIFGKGHSMGLRAYGVAVLAAAALLWAMSGTQKEKPVLAATQPPGRPDTVRALELSAALHPDSAEPTRALAQAYLDVRQPGLAVVLVEGATPTVRDDVRVQHVYARALVDEGRNEEALAVERGVVASCSTSYRDGSGKEASRNGARATTQLDDRECDSVLLASAVRRTGILRELVSLGVEDAEAHPEMSLLAYQNATREARVAAQ